MTITNTRSQHGFTLLEMVIILGIIGTLIGTFLSFYQPTQTSQANATTKLKMERVLNAVSSFALRNNRLPCPADPRANPTSGAPTAAACAGVGVMGIVPYAALGLTQEDAQDGFGRYFTYIVHGPLTDSPGGSAGADFISRTANPPLVPVAITGSDFCDLGSGMTVTRRDTVAGTTVNEANGNVAMVLIAYGADGFGAYNMTRTDTTQRNRPIGDGNLDNLLGERERLNAVDQTGSANQSDISDYITFSNPLNNHFDDYVSYMTLQGVISRLGVTACH